MKFLSFLIVFVFISNISISQEYLLINLTNRKYYDAGKENKMVLLKDKKRVADYAIKMKTYGTILKKGEVLPLHNSVTMVLSPLCDKMKLTAYIDGEIVATLSREVRVINRPIIMIQEDYNLPLKKLLSLEKIEVYDPNSPEKNPKQFQITKGKFGFIQDGKIVEINISSNILTDEIKNFATKISAAGPFSIYIQVYVKSELSENSFPVGSKQFKISN